MDATLDPYWSHFTVGQLLRMQAQAGQHAPLIFNGNGRTLHLNQTLTIDANEDYTFFDVDVRVAASQRIAVNGGRLRAVATTFEPLNEMAGWGGIVANDGNITLGAGTTVRGVLNAPAVAVGPGSEATLDGATIHNPAGGSGVFVYGKGSATASVQIVGATQIDGNGGAGVEVAPGGYARIDGVQVEVFANDAEGVLASGVGARVLVTEGTFASNGGPAFRAAAGARIDILRDPGFLDPTSSLQAHPNQAVWASGNAGGLYASGISRKVAAGGISTGDVVCVQAPCPSIGQHSFTLNYLGAPFDVESEGGGTVIAVENYWGPNRTAAQLELNVDETSFAAVAPTLLIPPSAAGSSSSARSAVAPPPAQESVDAEPSVLRAGFWTLVREAEAHAQAGQGDAAASRLIQAYRGATSDVERYAVAEAAGRALAVVQPAALLTWAQQASALPGRDRPWARRALAVALLATGQYGEAAATAQALADEDGRSALALAPQHRVRGLTLRAEVALAAGDAAASATALAALLALDPEAASTLVVAHALAFADSPALAVVPPGATLVPADAAGTETGLAVIPNPSAEEARVLLPALGGSDRVSVAVFDTLGREVRRLHDGLPPADLRVGGLPAGAYVLRAVMHHADGTTSVHARSFTVAR